VDVGVDYRGGGAVGVGVSRRGHCLCWWRGGGSCGVVLWTGLEVLWNDACL